MKVGSYLWQTTVLEYLNGGEHRWRTAGEGSGEGDVLFFGSKFGSASVLYLLWTQYFHEAQPAGLRFEQLEAELGLY